MVSLFGVLGYLVIVVVHTLIAAVATRFFRLRLQTTWGSALYTMIVTPLLLLVSTLVLSGALGLGADLGGRDTAIILAIVLPLALGYVVDVFWMPAPEEIDVPDRARERRT